MLVKGGEKDSYSLRHTCAHENNISTGKAPASLHAKLLYRLDLSPKLLYTSS